jgi:hypothetical protein
MTSTLRRQLGLISCVALLQCACARAWEPKVEGVVATEDAREGVPCRLDLKDRGYKDHRSVGMLSTESGRRFSGLLHDDTRGPLHPAGRDQTVEVSCTGYAVATIPLNRRHMPFVYDLGTILVHRSERPSAQ